MTSRAFGKCKRKGCGGRKVLEVQGIDSLQAMFALRRHGCPVCGWHKTWDVDLTRATYRPETPCRQSCTDAMTPSCKCSCGGSHHGENVAEYDKWSGS